MKKATVFTRSMIILLMMAVFLTVIGFVGTQKAFATNQIKDQIGSHVSYEAENSEDFVCGKYTVEFRYGDSEYVMQGGTTIPLETILEKLNITGEVSNAECSNDELFSVSKNNNHWVVKANQAFLSKEWMKVTINGIEHTIAVTDNPYPQYNYYNNAYSYQIACTWYAWQQAKEQLGIELPSNLGHAGSWYGNAPYPKGSAPQANSIACWNFSGTSRYGHVAYVTAVNGDGSINIVEGGSGWTGNDHGICARTVRPGAYWPDQGFIYLQGSAPPQETINRVYPSGSANIGDGTYTIVSKLGMNKCLDVASGGKSNGTNLWLYERANDDVNQQFRITKQPDGKTYRIQAVTNDLYIDNGGSNNNGFNTHLWEWASTGAQMWYIVDRGDGWYSFVNHYSGLSLDVENGNAANMANIRQWSNNGSDAQKFRLFPTDSTNIPNGTYTIVSKLGMNKCLDVASGGKSNGTNLWLYERANDDVNQQFRITKQSDGKTYRIQAVSNDLYVDNGGSTDNGFNTHLWEWGATGAQIWYIIDTGDGWYSFVNHYSGLSLDVENGNAANMANIRQWSNNGSDAQKFRLFPTDSTNIPDGTYTIVSKLGMNKCLDVASGGKSNGTNLWLYERANDDVNQQFRITKQSDGKTYRIQAVSNDLYIDNGGSNNNGFNTHLWEWASTGAQMWYIIDAGDGWYSFVNHDSGLSLDVESGNSANMANIRQWSNNGSDAQKFRLFPTDSANIPDGTYTIASRLNPNMVLDVASGGKSNGTNLWLYKRANNDVNQQFRISKQSDGKTYRIQAVSNNLYIDNGDSNENGFNTHLWAWTSSGSQMWNIIDTGDGWYSIVNHDSGLSLDVENGNATSMANIRQWMGNNSDAQRFRFVPVEGTPAPSETGGSDQQEEQQTLPEQPTQPEQPEQPIDTGLPQINYRTHVQNVGWQSYVANGAVAGTSGRSLRLEGMNINLQNQNYTGDIEYRTHIQNIGWENGWKKNDDMSGTSGRSLRLEAMQVRLTGEMAEYYDVYYRVHAQNIGWMGWAKNGEEAGTAGHAYRLEAMQIMLVDKGGAAPNLAPACNDYRAFVQK